MNTLEELKELIAAEKSRNWEIKQWADYKDPVIYGGEKGAEGLGKDAIATVFVTDYAVLDRAKLIVTAVNALPALIAVAEAALEWHKTKMVLRESDVDTNAQAATDYYVASDGLSAALAKLEGGSQ
jgi:hypothetical protein